jgi:hypothetical protein
MTGAIMKAQSSETNEVVTVRSRTARGTKVKFGNVTISGAKPAKAVVSANVAFSSQALERVLKAIIKPGVALREKSGVPQFWASEDRAGVYVRKLNGKTDVGTLVDGVFRVID